MSRCSRLHLFSPFLSSRTAAPFILPASCQPSSVLSRLSRGAQPSPAPPLKLYLQPARELHLQFAKSSSAPPKQKNFFHKSCDTTSNLYVFKGSRSLLCRSGCNRSCSWIVKMFCLSSKRLLYYIYIKPTLLQLVTGSAAVCSGLTQKLFLCSLVQPLLPRVHDLSSCKN